jgi:XTP/dITP diphosphohydrolase
VSAGRLVWVTASPRLPPGTMTWPAWQALRESEVLSRSDNPHTPFVRAAGVDVSELDTAPTGALVEQVAARVRERPGVAWLVGPDGDLDLAGALRDLPPGVDGAAAIELEVVPGSIDPPGARLLDAVAVMDRLRSPGGCPWDAEQTHSSLAPYLLEETYEALGALEEGDLAGLRDELGDVLLQVLFHARLAEEHGEHRWSVDDLAEGLVEKLVRRHPHVFGDVEVSGAAEVNANWDAIKVTEGRRSVVEGVALGQPALSLAGKLQRRARRAGVPLEAISASLAAAPTVAAAVAAMASGLVEDDVPPTVDRVGDLLFHAVTLALDADVDPEAALRGVSRRFLGQLTAAEELARARGREPDDLAEGDWVELLRSAGEAGPGSSRPAHVRADDRGALLELDEDGVPYDLPEEPVDGVGTAPGPAASGSPGPPAAGG